ncbi:helix-turn-helix domain-containing protein [Achromobacter xylosoxidans]
MNQSEAKRVLKEIAHYGSQRKAAMALGLARSTVGERVNKAREVLGDVVADRLLGDAKHAGPAPTKKTDLAEAIAGGDKAAIEHKLLEDEVIRLRAVNKSLAKGALTDEKVRRHIFEIAHAKPAIPEWLEKAPGSSDTLPGVPILFGSDWHWGEVVNPDEIGGVNKYNLEIAHQRLNRLVETTIELLTNHMVNPKYPGIVFALGGDMVSGDIHEELSETNEHPIMPVVLDLIDHLVIAIKRLKQVFGRVFLPCVAGNHGRNTHKVRAKQFNHNSFDWLIYQSLDRRFADDPDVVFYIPEGTDALVNVAGHRYLFSHGNQFRSGDSMIGPLGPIIRGDHKKRGRNAQVGQEYDTLVIGHWHQLVQMKRVIVNGSLIGYNEYAYANNFGYEPPQQALWLSHPKHGITFSMPVNVDEDIGRTRRDLGKQAWVSWDGAKKAA